MKSLPIEFKFRGQWRPYQRRVLLELEGYLQDDHVHLVAAPGSGKTILGLEILRRLNMPTLILAPTLTIRNQWIDRMVGLFLPDGTGVSDWVTTNIKRPALITVSTYQGLHSVFGDHTDPSDEADDDEDTDDTEPVDSGHISRKEWLSRCKKAGISVLVVDEAHHLRREWWKTLTALKHALNKPRVISLTATPPYDVNSSEWDRYDDFCGPIDAEISVPELVLEQNLCPHQDYVYFSFPSVNERTIIQKYRKGIESFYRRLHTNRELIELVHKHPWIMQTEQYMEEILSNPEYMSSMVLFLKHCSEPVPNSYFRVLGITSKTLPEFSMNWAQILLTGLLFEETRTEFSCHSVVHQLGSELGPLGAIENRKVVLTDTLEIHRLLSRSVGKLDSIADIVRLEANSLGDNLRCVILTDYILKEVLSFQAGEKPILNKIGAGSIFETLRQAQLPVKLGVLTGSMIIVPTESLPLLVELMERQAVPAEHYQFRPLETDSAYCWVHFTSERRQDIVKLITPLFAAGGITVLVGTKSLLGEGWDEPAVNTLILASFVGTYMLTNQMRGRAIRIRPGYLGKTANIWHLVCVESDSTAGADFDTVTSRFQAFLGVSNKANRIESGIERMDIGNPPFTPARIRQINTAMQNQAADRNRLAQRWQTSLKQGLGIAQIVEEIKTQKVFLSRGFIFRNTLAAMLCQGFFWGSAVFMRVLEEIYSNSNTPAGMWRGVEIAFIAGALAFLPHCFRTIRLYFKNMPAESYLRQISLALIKTLQFQGWIKTIGNKPSIITRKEPSGHVYCGLADGTAYERNLFIMAMQELLNPVQNPRYVLISKQRWLKLVRTNYFAVPQIIGQKREYAEYFARMWSKYVGDAELIYTRNEKGRRLLLKARTEAMSAAFVKHTETLTCWR